MKGIILLNGEPYNNSIPVESSDYIIACDGAFAWARNKGIAVDLVLGDFDSLGFIPDGAERYNSEKNETDGELAVLRLIEKKAEEIHIYGGGGGRDDHYIANLGLLYRAYTLGVNATLFTNYCSLRIIGDKKYECEAKVGSTYSLTPVFEEAEIESGSGFKYPIDGLILKYGATRGISNVAVENRLCVCVKRGLLFFIEVKRELSKE